MADYTTVTTTTSRSGTLWMSSGTGAVEWSRTNDPENWNLVDGELLTADNLNRAFMPTPDFFTARIARPNALRRLIWKWALGVTWSDLRPERAMRELKGLK